MTERNGVEFGVEKNAYMHLIWLSVGSRLLRLPAQPLAAGNGEIRSRNFVQQRAKPDGAPFTESSCESCLRLFPTLASYSQALDARLGQPKLLAAAVGLAGRCAEKAVAYERQDVPTKRGAVHHQFIRQSIDGHRS
jgi:hypothetical protein